MESVFFSVNIPSSESIEKTDLCGCVSGNKVDKSNIFDFTMFIGEIVAAYANEDCVENGKPNALNLRQLLHHLYFRGKKKRLHYKDLVY